MRKNLFVLTKLDSLEDLIIAESKITVAGVESLKKVLTKIRLEEQT